MFAREIYPVLTPLAVGPGQPFPYISGLSLSLGLLVRDPESGEERFARVKVPEGLPRFLGVGERGLQIPLESAIEHFLPLLFPEMEIVERAAFRLTRDGDTEISDDADDLLEAVETELHKRRFGAVVRLEVSSSISRSMLARLEERLVVQPNSVYPVPGLARPRRRRAAPLARPPRSQVRPWVPYTQRRLAAPADDDLFAEIAQRDIVVQHPYDSFSTSVESFVRAASRDEHVVTLKTTVYRTSHDSALAPALMVGSENGKQCVCVVELKARSAQSHVPVRDVVVDELDDRARRRRRVVRARARRRRSRSSVARPAEHPAIDQRTRRRAADPAPTATSRSSRTARRSRCRRS